LKTALNLLWQLNAWQPNVLWPSTKSVRSVCKSEFYVEPETLYFRQFLHNDMYILFNRTRNWCYFESCDEVFSSCCLIFSQLCYNSTYIQKQYLGSNFLKCFVHMCHDVRNSMSKRRKVRCRF
jgi:hypothetical protein